VFSSTLSNCIVSGNAALDVNGGGAWVSTLYNCLVTGNRAYRGGGGQSCTLSNCVLTANSAFVGGGADFCTISNCLVNANSAYYSGGVNGGAVYNSAIVGNSADDGAGGAEAATLVHCTLTGNSAYIAGGADGCALTDCIVYYNRAPIGSNHWNSALDYCCTMPLPDGGTSNLTAEPKLASASHVSAGSPCRGAGSADASGGRDIDGEPWAIAPAIGCDEYYAGTLTGALSVVIQAPYTNAATGFDLDLIANILGKVSVSTWNFGDGTVVSNQPYASHHWNAAAAPRALSTSRSVRCNMLR
jgi:hypothetical protein